jgi:hypothetical protein
MLVRRGLAMLSFAGVASWSGLAGAQYFRADPGVLLSGGYIFSRIISDNPAIDPVDQSGPLVTLAPSLALTYDTPRVTQKLALTTTFGLPFARDFTLRNQPPSYSFRLHYDSTVPLDPRTTLTLTGTMSAAPIISFATLQDASTTPLDAPPGDLSYNFTLTGTESLKHELSEAVSLTQLTNLLYALPINVDPIRASTLTVKNSLALSRKWTLDTLSLTGTVGVTRFGPGEVNGGVSDTRVQVINDLTLMWKRPFTESLTGTLHAGVSQTISPSSGVPPAWQPTGGATLLYNLTPVSITLVYSYAAIVNTYTATTNLNNQVALRALLPLSTTGLSVAGSAGYVHSVPVGSVDTGPANAFNSITSDLGLTYAPVAVPKLSFILRALYARQIPLEAPINAVTRYGVNFNVAFSYPNTTAVNAISRLTPAFIPSSGGDVLLGQETPDLDPSPPPAEPTAPAAPIESAPALPVAP